MEKKLTWLRLFIRTIRSSYRIISANPGEIRPIKSLGWYHNHPGDDKLHPAGRQPSISWFRGCLTHSKITLCRAVFTITLCRGFPYTWIRENTSCESKLHRDTQCCDVYILSNMWYDAQVYYVPLYSANYIQQCDVSMYKGISVCIDTSIVNFPLSKKDAQYLHFI